MMATEATQLSDVEVAEIEAKIKAQGDIVRGAKEALKAGTGDKATVDSAVALLLQLKGQLPAAEAPAEKKAPAASKEGGKKGGGKKGGGKKGAAAEPEEELSEDKIIEQRKDKAHLGILLRSALAKKHGVGYFIGSKMRWRKRRIAPTVRSRGVAFQTLVTRGFFCPTALPEGIEKKERRRKHGVFLGTIINFY